MRSAALQAVRPCGLAAAPAARALCCRQQRCCPLTASAVKDGSEAGVGQPRQRRQPSQDARTGSRSSASADAPVPAPTPRAAAAGSAPAAHAATARPHKRRRQAEDGAKASTSGRPAAAESGRATAGAAAELSQPRPARRTAPFPAAGIASKPPDRSRELGYIAAAPVERAAPASIASQHPAPPGAPAVTGSEPPDQLIPKLRAASVPPTAVLAAVEVRPCHRAACLTPRHASLQTASLPVPHWFTCLACARRCRHPAASVSPGRGLHSGPRLPRGARRVTGRGAVRCYRCEIPQRT
jgi:hypothetical protein